LITRKTCMTDSVLLPFLSPLDSPQRTLLPMQASIEMPGIKGLWSLRASGSSLFDKYLVQSYIGETRVLSIDGEEMGEVRDMLTAQSALLGRTHLAVI
jgi:hypothetical protein